MVDANLEKNLIRTHLHAKVYASYGMLAGHKIGLETKNFISNFHTVIFTKYLTEIDVVH